MTWIWRGLAIGIGMAFARPLLEQAARWLEESEDTSREKDLQRQAEILAPAIARALKEHTDGDDS